MQTKMQTKRICSLGILDININIFIYESQMLDMNLNIDSYNTIDDLSKLFQILNSNIYLNNNSDINNKEEEKIKSYNNFENCITLDSDNCLINTLLYINKAYKIKTFIEFIIPDKLTFIENNKYLKNLIDEILSKNYLFIIESDKGKKNFSRINFIIKIVDDLIDTIKSTKKFELIGNNKVTSEDCLYNLNDNYEFEKKFINHFNYNFNKIDFFIIDLKEIRKILIKEKNIYNFILKIINRFSRLKIILIIDEDIITNNSEKEEISSTKKFIELCDIIFSFKKNLNNFLKYYYTLNKRKLIDKNPSKIFFVLNSKNLNLNTIDLITKDLNKTRKNIPRTSILFDQFNSIQIYEQDIKNKNLSYNNIFSLFLIQEEMTEEKKDFLTSNSNKLYHIFISGFISRLVYNKPFDICFEVGNLLMKKALNILSKNELSIYDSYFNISIKKNGYNFFKQIKKDLEKEKNFILDCTNKEKSKPKEYNILTDNNCLGYLTRRYFFKNYKNPSLKDKVNIFLKGKRIKSESHINKKDDKNVINLTEKNKLKNNTIKKLLPFIVNNDIKEYKKAKEKLYSNNIKNLKTISYYSHSRHIYKNIIKKSLHSKNIIKNCLHNINKAENYNKYLFKLYFPLDNYRDYINNNNL